MSETEGFPPDGDQAAASLAEVLRPADPETLETAASTCTCHSTGTDKRDEPFRSTWAGGHALIIEFGDEEFLAHCQCGAYVGQGTPMTSLDEFARPWERHVMGLPAAGVEGT